MAEIIVLDEIKTSAKHGVVTRTDRVADSDGKTLDAILSEIDAKASSASVEPMTSGVPSTAPKLAGLKINSVAYKIPEGGSSEVVEFSFEDEVKKLKKEIDKTGGLIPAGSLLNQLNAFVPGAHSISDDAAGYLYQFMHFYFDCEQGSMEYENPTKLMMQITAEEYSHYNVIHKRTDGVEYKGFSYEWQDHLVSVLMNITFTASPFNMQVMFDCVESAPTIVEANPTDTTKFAPSGEISRIGIGNKLYTLNASKVTCTTNADGTLKTIKVDGNTYNLPADVITSVNGKIGEVELTGSDIKIKNGSAATIAAKIDSIDLAIADKSKVVAKGDEAGNLKQLIVNGETYNVPEGGEGGGTTEGSEVVATDDTDGYLKNIKVDGVSHDIKPIPEENLHVVDNIPSDIKENHLYVTKGGIIHHGGEVITETIYDNPVFNVYPPDNEHGIVTFGYFHYGTFQDILNYLPRRPRVKVLENDISGTTVYALALERICSEANYSSYKEYCEAVLGKSFEEFTDLEVNRYYLYDIYAYDIPFVNINTLSLEVDVYDPISNFSISADDLKVTLCPAYYFRSQLTGDLGTACLEITKTGGIEFKSIPVYEKTTKLATVGTTEGLFGQMIGGFEIVSGYCIGPDLGCPLLDALLAGEEPEEITPGLFEGKDYIPVYGLPLNAASTPAEIHSQIPDFIAEDGSPIGQIGPTSSKWNVKFRAGKSNINVQTPAYDEITKPSIKIGIKSGGDVTLSEYGNVFVVDNFPTSNLVEGNIYIKNATETTNTEIKIAAKVDGEISLKTIVNLAEDTEAPIRVEKTVTGQIAGPFRHLVNKIIITKTGEEAEVSVVEANVDTTVPEAVVGGPLENLYINGKKYTINNGSAVGVNKKNFSKDYSTIKCITVDGVNYKTSDIYVDNVASHYGASIFLPKETDSDFPVSGIAVQADNANAKYCLWMYAAASSLWMKILDKDAIKTVLSDSVVVNSDGSFNIGTKTINPSGYITTASGDNLATSNIGGNSSITGYQDARTNDTSHVRILHALKTNEGGYNHYWDLPLTLGTTTDVCDSTNELRTIKINGVAFRVGSDRQDYDYYPDVQSMPEGHIVNLTRDLIDPLSVDEHITDPVCIWLAPDWRSITYEEASVVFSMAFPIDTDDTPLSPDVDTEYSTFDKTLFKDDFYGGRRATAFKYENYAPIGSPDFEIPSEYLDPLYNKRFIRPTAGFCAIKDDSTFKATTSPKQADKRTNNITAYNYYRQLGATQELFNCMRFGTASIANYYTYDKVLTFDKAAYKMVLSERNSIYDATSQSNSNLIKRVSMHTGECAVAVCDVVADETSPMGFKFENPSSFTQSLVYGVDYIVVSYSISKATGTKGNWYTGPLNKSIAILLRNVGATTMSDPGFYFQYGDRFPVHYANPSNSNYNRMIRRDAVRDSVDTKKHLVSVDMYNGGDYSHKMPALENYSLREADDWHKFLDPANNYITIERPWANYTSGTYGSDYHVKYDFYRLRNFKDDAAPLYTTLPKGRYQVVKDSTTGLKKLERIYTFNKEQYDKIMALIAD